jgi:hypothetical protein
VTGAVGTAITVRILGSGEWGVWRRLRLTCLREAQYAFFGSAYQAEAAADEESRRAKWIREPSSLGPLEFSAGLEYCPTGERAPAAPPGGQKLRRVVASGSRT